MRAWIVFVKTMREMRRDVWVVGLTLAFAPLFVLIYWMWFYGGSTTYTILVIDHDPGVDGWSASREAAAAIQAVSYADGKPLLVVRPAANITEAEVRLRQRQGVAFIEFPADFSLSLQAMKSGDRSQSTGLVFGGDLTNTYYAIGAVLAINAVDAYVQQYTGQAPLVKYSEKALGGSAARSEFETYVPGVIILAVILLIFQAAMTAAREIETGALRRLRLTPMTSFDLLAGISAALSLVGMAAVLLTFATAVALGFRSQGPLWLAALVSAVTCFSIIGIGLLVASFTRSVSQAFVVANFPLGLLMFFSGAIFPMPKFVLFTLAGQEVALYDILPPTHAVAALNKVLTLGAGLQDVAYELGALVVLSLLYFLLGVLVFQRMQIEHKV